MHTQPSPVLVRDAVDVQPSRGGQAVFQIVENSFTCHFTRLWTKIRAHCKGISGSCPTPWQAGPVVDLRTGIQLTSIGISRLRFVAHTPCAELQLLSQARDVGAGVAGTEHVRIRLRLPAMASARTELKIGVKDTK